jgi:diguanylate cyclase (GGDEF)-like protein
MLQALASEKLDLEILVQILIDQGDQSAEEGGKARIDALTQIANRRRFDEFLCQEWAKHLRLRQPLALMMCDVDHFKLFNDHYGHQAGDECLKSVGQAIANSVRTQDLAARCGGEEFAVVLPNSHRQAAKATAARVAAAVAAANLPHATSPTSDRVTLSIGVVCTTPYAEGDTGMRAFMEEADQLLYLAKRRGRNCIADQKRGDPQKHDE